jgi:hypothetical protein
VNILKRLLTAIGKYSLVPLCICLFGIFVYPTMYKYDKLDQKYPVKINRITGETTVLTGKGWQNAEDYNSAAEEMSRYKDQIIAEIESQNESIKADVLLTIQEELDVIAEKQASIATRPGNEVSEPADENIEEVSTDSVEGERSDENFFELGDTKDTVKKIMGVPDSIIGAEPFVMWYYGDSRVDFKDGKVSGWDNDGNLPLR